MATRGALFLCAVLAGATALSDPVKTEGGAEVNKGTVDYLVQPLRNIQKPGIQMYMAGVSVGTPPQQMSVTFEMVSNISYVPSQSCQDPNCLQRSRYDSAASSTYQAVGTPFSLPYGQNTSGILSQDVLAFAGVSLSRQTFGEATHMLATWQQYLPNDGAFGLGYNGQIMADLKTQGLISQRVAGLYFGKGTQDGELTLGGVNEARYTGELQYVDVVPEAGVWSMHVDDIAIKDLADVELCGPGGCTAVPITSTPFFTTSMEQAETINQALGGRPLATPGSYYFDCTSLCDKPTVTVSLGGRQITLSGRDYTLVSNIPGGLQMCISGFLGTPYMTGKNWGFGTNFFQQVFTVYDGESGRIGFAESA